MGEISEKKSTEDFNRESYLRWTENSITQLGYTINLMLTLAGAALALGAKTMMESKEVLPSPHHYSFHMSVVALGLSVFLAVAANFTRAFHFRNTRRAARARMTNNGKHDIFHDRADEWGEWTWGLFIAQSVAFAIGVIAFAASIWGGFGHKI